MTVEVSTPPFDERLTALLEVEQRLERQTRDAEARAQARVEAARRGVDEARRQGEAAAEEAWRAESAAGAATRGQTLERLDEEARAIERGLGEASTEVIEALADEVLARVLGARSAP